MMQLEYSRRHVSEHTSSLHAVQGCKLVHVYEVTIKRLLIADHTKKTGLTDDGRSCRNL